MNTNWEKWVIAFFAALANITTLLTLGRVRPRWSSYYHTKYAKPANDRWQEQRAEKLKICRQCNYSFASEREWHAPYCVKAPHNQLVSNMLMYKHNEEAFKVREKRLREQVTFWQGKFSLVKHENNQLRKKLMTT